MDAYTEAVLPYAAIGSDGVWIDQPEFMIHVPLRCWCGPEFYLDRKGRSRPIHLPPTDRWTDSGMLVGM